MYQMEDLELKNTLKLSFFGLIDLTKREFYTKLFYLILMIKT